MDAQHEIQPHQVVGQKSNPMVGRIWTIAEPLCLSEGIDLVHVEFQREQSGRTLRLYIDKPGGVTLADCTEISRQLGDLLDATLETELAYRLEVSSPGLDRPLGKLSDFERFVGRQVKLRTACPINGQKRFTGIMEDVDHTRIRLKNNDQIVDVPFDLITRAQVLWSEGI